MTSEAFTAAELSAFSAKLDGWSQTLDDREQTLLRGLIGLATWGAQHHAAGSLSPWTPRQQTEPEARWD